MGFVNKLKGLSEDLKDKVGTMSDSMVSKVSACVEKLTDKADESTDVLEINSIKELNKWIAAAQADATNSVSFALQAQLSALKSVETSVLSGMVVDNILVCLQKALNASESEKEKGILRDSFASLLQSVVFVSEARLQYDIKKNKEAAIQILTSAGNMISMSASAVASLLIPTPGKAIKIVPIINNVLNPAILDVGSVSALLSAKKKHELLEERIKDHNKMLNNLFKTLDRYYDMIGPSILVHGMLSRYTDQLVDEFIEEQDDDIKVRTSKFSTQMKQFVDEMGISMHYELNSKRPGQKVQRAIGFLNTLRSGGKVQEELGYDEVNHIYLFLKERYTSLVGQISELKAELSQLQTRHDSLGLFQQAAKAQLAIQMMTIDKRVKKLNVSLTDIDEKNRIVEGIILPVNKRVEEYSAELHRIAEKYAIC